MNTLKYIFIIIVGVLLFTSCAEEDNFISNIEEGTNLAGFTNSSQNVANISDGSEYPVVVRMQLTGPSVRDLSGDVTVTVQPVFDGIVDSMKAEEGTHFRIDNNQLTLKESDNYLGKFHFTMLTQGITAPETAKLKLKATDASGADNVVNSGKPISVDLSYSCASMLEGTYYVTGTREDGTTYNAHTRTEEITKTGVGSYVTGSIAGFWTEPGSPYRPSTQFSEGLTFTDQCGSLTVPTQSLGPYSNEVSGTEVTEVTVGDSQTGGLPLEFTLKYYVVYSGTEYNHTFNYVKQ